MPRWPFRRPAEKDRPAVPPVADGAAVSGRGEGTPPRPEPAGTVVISDARREQRVRDLRRRREGILLDIEQGELAQSADNPWSERITLLQESIATIAADRAAIDRVPPAPTADVPAMPVTGIEVEPGEPARVRFTVGSETFTFVEATDWDNRGGMVVRGDLRPIEGAPAALLPTAPPVDWEDVAMAALLAYALGLRDAALDGTAPPAVATLRDIVREDPEAGGWTNLHGSNPIRAERAHHRQALRAEQNRLEDAITAEMEQRRTLTDRLPIARRRLTTVDDDLRSLGVDPDA